jgi:hypothetical protein
VAELFQLLWEQWAGFIALDDPSTGEPNGRAARWDTAHRHGLWHATAAVVVVDDRGRIGLQVRRQPQSRGLLDVSAAGHQLPSEPDMRYAGRGTEAAGPREPNDRLAALRHLRQDLGLDIEAARLRPYGRSYEFRKEGASGAGSDSHESLHRFRYRATEMDLPDGRTAPKDNRESLSVFILSLAPGEAALIPDAAAQGRPAIQWTCPRRAAEDARLRPQLYASCFRHLFGHPRNAEVLCSASEDAAAGRSTHGGTPTL